MQYINLCHKEKGNVNYEIIHFPDGQAHIKLMDELNHKDEVQVDVRITNAEWLFLLLQLLDICNRHGISPVVNIWYLMGARMDRVMSFNEPFTLQLIQNMLNGYSAYFKVFEAHNPREALKYPNWDEIPPLFEYKRHDVLCFPDKGASLRYRTLETYIFCRKKRNTETGELSGFELVLNNTDINGKDVLVKDDLCDGGRTFCGIAPLIREHNPKSLSLSVRHAIQKEGILKVAALYDKVYITNSYKDWQDEELPENVVVELL